MFKWVVLMAISKRTGSTNACFGCEEDGGVGLTVTNCQYAPKLIFLLSTKSPSGARINRV